MNDQTMTTDRRGFLARTLRLLCATPLSLSALACAAGVEGQPEVGTDATARGQETGLSKPQWELVAAVQAHLLPSEPGIPGARELAATHYLRRVLVDARIDASERRFFRRGVDQLEALCRARFARRFVALTAREREEALRALEQSPDGRAWLHEMLEFLLEAALGDPSHGGNPDGIGWRWLGIVPGFPRPASGTSPGRRAG